MELEPYGIERKMYVLGIETSTAVGTIAVVRDGEVLVSETIATAMDHSSSLLPVLDRVLRGLKVSIRELDGVGIGIGPGSYTGVRVGIAFAKGLQFAMKKPLIGVCSLEAMTYSHSSFDGQICVLMDAKIEIIYWAVYEWKGRRLKIIQPPTITPIQEIQVSGQRIIFLSPDIGKYGEILRERFGRGRDIVMEVAYPQAEYVALKALERIETGAYNPEAKIEPYYLRPSTAELKFRK